MRPSETRFTPPAREFERFERAYRLMLDPQKGRQTRFLSPEGRPIDIPPTLLSVIQEAAVAFEKGTSLTLIPTDHDLTTQEAADILAVSRQYLVRLLDRGQLPFHRVGTHRRIRQSDLLAYKQVRDARCAEKLDELTRISQELGLD